VATPDGEHAIGSLQVGVQVEAYDPETGKRSTQTVEHVWINQDHDLIDVTLQSDVRNQIYALDDAAKQQGAEMVGHGLRAPPTPMNRAGSTSDRETMHTTAEHPWLTTDRIWQPTSQLRLGDQVRRADGSTATVVALAVVPGVATRYNLTVSHLHTFTVGDGQYVVHNVCLQPYKVGSVRDGHHIFAKAAFRGLAK
jgi:hypothetical protein